MLGRCTRDASTTSFGVRRRATTGTQSARVVPDLKHRCRASRRPQPISAATKPTADRMHTAASALPLRSRRSCGR